MPPNIFQEGLEELNKYLKNLYLELDNFVGQFDKNAGVYAQIEKNDKQYRSYINDFKGKLKIAIDRSDLKAIADNSGALYQILNPEKDGTKAIKNLYTNLELKKIVKNLVDVSLFENGAKILENYYLKPIQAAIEEAQKRKKAMVTA
jgi:hypothetical protein